MGSLVVFCIITSHVKMFKLFLTLLYMSYICLRYTVFGVFIFQSNFSKKIYRSHFSPFYPTGVTKRGLNSGVKINKQM